MVFVFMEKNTKNTMIQDAIRKMAWEERLEKEHPFIEKYEEEFEKHGIEKLEVKDNREQAETNNNQRVCPITHLQ